MALDILELLRTTINHKASDLHITVALPPVIRVNGRLIQLDEKPLTPEDVELIAKQILSEKQFDRLDDAGEIDLSYANPGLGRFRVNIYKQRGSYGIALRAVSLTIPALEELGIPSVARTLAQKPRGLVLVTGPTGSGKSTTLAAMIDYINKNSKQHILTLEDPIEYLHKHNKCIVNQREIGNDSKSFAHALRSSLRQDPDVILLGEMRDLETIGTAITAAETGHLVLSSLHTIGAAKTIDRIIDVFPPEQQQQIKVQLSGVLEGVISQQLIPKTDNNGRVPAVEIMVCTPAIRNLIREGKTHQIQGSVQTGSKFGMKTMDNSLIDLYMQGIITREAALEHSVDRETLERMIGF